MRTVSNKSCTENQNTHFMFNNFSFPWKLCHLWDNVEKSCRTGHATDDMMHAHCTLHTYGYQHTLRICYIYCFSTATMVAQTPLSGKLYVYCLSCLCLNWKMWLHCISLTPWDTKFAHNCQAMSEGLKKKKSLTQHCYRQLRFPVEVKLHKKQNKLHQGHIMVTNSLYNWSWYTNTVTAEWNVQYHQCSS